MAHFFPLKVEFRFFKMCSAWERLTLKCTHCLSTIKIFKTKIKSITGYVIFLICQICQPYPKANPIMWNLWNECFSHTPTSTWRKMVPAGRFSSTTTVYVALVNTGLLSSISKTLMASVRVEWRGCTAPSVATTRSS